MAEAKHDDGSAMLLASLMNSVSRVVATSSFAPDARCEWETNVAPIGITDPVQATQLVLTYNNLMYDIIAAGLAKLGVEYSKLITGAHDSASFDKEMKAVLETLNAGTAAK